MLLQRSELPAAKRQQWLQHAIAPRPIALVSSVNKKMMSQTKLHLTNIEQFRQSLGEKQEQTKKY